MIINYSHAHSFPHATLSHSSSISHQHVLLEAFSVSHSHLRFHTQSSPHATLRILPLSLGMIFTQAWCEAHAKHAQRRSPKKPFRQLLRNFSFLRHTPFSPYVAPRFPHMSESKLQRRRTHTPSDCPPHHSPPPPCATSKKCTYAYILLVNIHISSALTRHVAPPM